jgi:hypothetical protein
MIATFTLARYRPDRLRALLARVPVERRRLRSMAGLAWGRHLGTAAGETTLGADLTRWAWFCVWNDADAAARFPAWVTAKTAPDELASLALQPLRARGAWSGDAISVPAAAPPASEAGPIAVLTRARVRPQAWRAFRAAVPAADAALGRADGRLASVGVGEWPILVQGTFSVWRDAAAIAAFSRQDADHSEVVRRTAAERWYGEELFARFAVTASEGTWDGRPTGTFAPCPQPPSTTPSPGS